MKIMYKIKNTGFEGDKDLMEFVVGDILSLALGVKNNGKGYISKENFEKLCKLKGYKDNLSYEYFNKILNNEELTIQEVTE